MLAVRVPHSNARRRGTDAARAGTRDPAALVKDVADYLRVLLEEKHQTLEFDLEKNAVAEGNLNTLRQALVNLLDTAIKYTPRGGRLCMAVKTIGQRPRDCRGHRSGARDLSRAPGQSIRTVLSNR